MTDDHDPPPTDTLDRHGDGEYEPHRPPKYVEGVYKPHKVTSDADFAIFKYPLDYREEPHVATVDDDGYVRKRDTGKPMCEGGTTIMGVVIDGDVHLSDLYEDTVDVDDLDLPGTEG